MEKILHLTDVPRPIPTESLLLLVTEEKEKGNNCWDLVPNNYKFDEVDEDLE